MATTVVGALRTDTRDLVTGTRILLVGAGGLGCEVLKNLVMTGFADIEVIDSGRVDVSDVNRRFMFDGESVRKPKSLVARESALGLNPNVNIKAHVGDVMDEKYGAMFFSEFQLVISTLDGKKARIRVNRMCTTCNIPLILSGATGYDGEVRLIKTETSPCYECSPIPEPESLGTIRNPPRRPSDCIIWSKFLYELLFAPLQPMDNEESIEEAAVREWTIENYYDPITLFKKIFIEDIIHVTREPFLSVIYNMEPVILAESIVNERSEYLHEPDTNVLSLNQYVTMFVDSVQNLWDKSFESDRSLVWDKTDEDIMNFVVATSNIRSEIFHIPLISHFDIRSRVDDKVKALPTANAIIAGQVVVHALRILKEDYKRCQSVYVRLSPNHKGAILNKDKHFGIPNPGCRTCSDEQIILSTNLKKFTMQQLANLVLKSKFNMVQPEVLINFRILISCYDEQEFNENLTLSEMNIHNGSIILAFDVYQNKRIKVVLHHEEKLESDDPDFVIFGSLGEMKVKQNEKKMSEKINDPEEYEKRSLEGEEINKVDKRME